MISLRHHFVFSLLRLPFALGFRLAFAYQAVPGPHLPYGQPALILANHNCAWDPFFVAMSFRRAIYYIASDHIFRLGLISNIISYLVSPVPIVKSQIDLRTLRTIRQIIQEGGIVGLFPEGNRSFHGHTGWIFPSTGKLAKQLGCPLILYRIRGGYLSTPRWSRHGRRGRMSGEVVRVMDTSELARLTPEEINRIIADTLHVDAFADQKERPIAFKGRRLAEYLERVLFICPRCRRLATLHSLDDHLGCDCGLDVRFTRFGFFEPIDAWSQEQAAKGDFSDTIGAWDHWQRQVLIELARDPAAPSPIDWSGERPIFHEEHERLYKCERARRSVLADEGSLTLYADRLVFSGRQNRRIYRLDDLVRLVVHGPQTVQFNTQDGQIMEVRSRLPRSAYKYVLLYHLLLQKRKGEPHGFFGL